MTRFGFILLIMLTVVGCDRPSRPIVAPTAPSHRVADFRPLVQLLPNRDVHAAVDSIGNILYTVESENGQDAVFVVGENGIPRATRLSSASILAALGQDGGKGTIQDLVPGRDGAVWFYFSGSRGKNVIAGIGQFSLRDDAIRIMFDTATLKQESGMSDAITLARGTLVGGDAWTHLLLRHSDGYAVLRFRTERAVPPAKNELARVLTAITQEDRTIDLRQPQFRLAGGADDKLLLMDRMTGELFELDASGKASLRAILGRMPKEMSLPLALRDGKLMFFAADSELIESELADPLTVTRERVTWPAVVHIDGKEITMIAREDLRVPVGFPAYALRIDKIVPAPGGTFIVYDRSSGQLMRLRLLEAP